MGEVLGSLLPHAFGIALSPLPVMGVVLMLTSTGGRLKAWSFIAGSFAALFALAILISLVASTQDDIDENHSDASNIAAWIKLGLGLLLFYMAYRYWTKRPKAGEVAEIPGWMKAIDKMSVTQSFGMGALLMGAKPKSLIILVAASITVAEANLGTAAHWVTILIFILMSLTFLFALALSPVIFGQRGETLLADVNAFLGQYNGVIMIILFAVLGAVLVGNGITGLFN